MVRDQPLTTCAGCPAPRQGRRKRCAPCQREHDRARLTVWRTANADKVKAQLRRSNRRRYEKDPEKGKARSAAWARTNRERANAHMREARRRRDAVQRGNDAERIDYLAVAERDGWTCALCGGAVDRDVRHPDPGSGSIDHRVPISLGGPHTYANVQLAHLGCNASKGNRAAA